MIYHKPVTSTNLQVIDSTESSLTIAWDSELAGMFFSIHVKHAALDDLYYRVAKTYLPGEIMTHTVEGLSSGTYYSIKLIIGQHDHSDFEGGVVEGRTQGTSLCGNGLIDAGEECDEGKEVWTESSHCTSECILTIVQLPTKVRQNYLS